MYVSLMAKYNDDIEEIKPIEDVGEATDPLALSGIEDKELIDTVDNWIEQTRSFYKEEYDLYEVRKRNEIYRFGRQISELIKGKRLKIMKLELLITSSMR